MVLFNGYSDVTPTYIPQTDTYVNIIYNILELLNFLINFFNSFIKNFSLISIIIYILTSIVYPFSFYSSSITLFCVMFSVKGCNIVIFV